MRRLVVDNSPESIAQIQQEIRRNNDSRYDHRLHGILLVAQGQTCSYAAQLLGHTVKTLENWVNAFNENGFNGIKDEPRPGRPTSLNHEELLQIDHDLRQNPREFGYSQNLWDGKLLSHHIEKEFGKTIGTRQSQRLFHKLGFRQRKPRPLIASSDPEKQADFKKTDGDPTTL